MGQSSTTGQCCWLQEPPYENTSEGEPGVGVVRPEGHAELHTAGEHAVGLGGAQRGKVVDQDTDVALCATDNERGLATNPEARVDASNHTLEGQKAKHLHLHLLYG